MDKENQFYIGVVIIIAIVGYLTHLYIQDERKDAWDLGYDAGLDGCDNSEYINGYRDGVEDLPYFMNEYKNMLKRQIR